MKTSMRLLSVLLALVLLLGMFPAAALAEEPEEPAEEALLTEELIEAEEAEEPAEEPAEEEPEAEPEELEEEPAEEAADEEEAEEEAEELPQSADADSSLGEGAEELPEEEAIAETYAASSGSCGDNLTWTLSDSGVLTISGTGAMTSYNSVSSVPWYDSRDSIERVVACSGVTSIGKNAFYGCGNLRLVVLPDSLTSIGGAAFQRCEALTEIVIPSGVTSIEWGAFQNCTELKKIYFEGSAPGIGSNAFGNVTATAYYPAWDASWTGDVRQPYGGTISWVCGGTCGPNLTWTLTDAGVLTISGTGVMTDYEDSNSNRAPWYNGRMSISAVVVEPGVTTIGDYAFFYCEAMTSASLPAGLKTIGELSFCGCTALSEINIPDGVTTIKDWAFTNDASLESLTLPDSVVTIGGETCSVFGYCTSLRSVKLPARLTKIQSCLFYGCSALISIEIPRTVSRIESSAFSGCTSLNRIVFLGSAPIFEGSRVFEDVSADAYYPGEDASWTESVRKNYGGHITWIAGRTRPTITVSGMARGGVSTSWTALTGATKYQLQKTDDKTGWKDLATVTDTYYTDGKVTMGVEYKYRVRAYVDSGWTDYSDYVNVRFNPFSDVDTSASNFSHIAWAYNGGIITGTSDTTFSPNSSLTRAQFVMMLWKMNGSPKVTGIKNPFLDVTGSKTKKAVLWALQKGIIVSGKSFKPNGNISRIQVIMILWKLAGSPTVKGVTNPYTDVTGSKTIKAMNWAYKKGVRGTGETTFQPNVNCSRADMVTFMYMTR